MRLYKEWTQVVQKRKGLMLPLESFSKLIDLANPGYSTVYAFLEEDALQIKEAGHSRNLDQYPVAASELTLDIDNGDAGLTPVVSLLTSLGLKHQIWSSGGKGYHVVIPHELILSKDLPYSHRKVVESWGIETDFSLYQHGRLLSLPNRVHPTTKRRKLLVREVEGQLLQVPIIPKPSSPTFNFTMGGGVEELTVALLNLAKITEAAPKEGNRHTTIWGAAKDLFRAGLDIETVYNLLEKVNESWPVPKSPQEVRNAVNQASQTIVKS